MSPFYPLDLSLAKDAVGDDRQSRIRDSVDRELAAVANHVSNRRWHA